MKREESDYMQDTSNKQIECIKVSEIDIIVSMMNGKPYYEIKYKKVGEDYYHIGYSSYNLDFVLEWKRKCFSLVRERKSVAGWIPVNERLPNEDEFIKSYRRNKYAAEFIVMIKGANRPTTLYFTHDGWWTDNMKDRYDVTAWMPLPEPYREVELPKQTNADRIRSMTDEELAIHMMCPNEMGLAEIECDKSDSCNCYECLLNWLWAESEV